MKKFYFLTLALICAFVANAAVTYNVTVPKGTKACYIAGAMTSWGFTAMTKVDDTHYTITIANATTSQKYKYCSGPGWGYVEKDASGNEIGDRTYKANDVVANWASVYDPGVELVNIVGGTVLYLKPNATWKAKNARFAAYFFGNNDTNAWASMEFVVDGTYSVTAPEGTWTNVIFCSMKGDNQTNEWNNKVQQTGNLTYDGTNNLYDIATNKWSVASDVVTAIEEVGVDAGAAVYYNLQGVKVANPENGIFIKKQGNKTTKVVL